MDYDPERLTYVQLLDLFWQSHRPTRAWRSRQYMHVIFYHNAKQEQLAKASKAAMSAKLDQTIQTKVLPLRTFTLAEAYHQKYFLKQKRNLNAALRRIYPNHRDYVDSTAVTRLNGYVGGNGRKEQFFREIDRLGLSEAGKREVKNIVQLQWKLDQRLE